MKPTCVRDIMAKKLLTFTPDTKVVAAMKRLVNRKFSGAPVIDKNGDLVGMLSELDCMETIVQNLYYRGTGGCVGEFISTNVTTVSPEMGIVDLAQMLQEKHFRRLPVVEKGKLIGQVSRRGLLKAIQ